MSRFDWIATIGVNLWVLRCVGLWPEKNKLYEPNFYTFYAAFNAIVIIGGHNLSQIIKIFFVYTDLEAVTATIFVLTTNILATIKMYFFVRNLNVIKQLFRQLNEQQFQPKSADQVNLIQPSLKRWMISYTVFHTIVATNVLLWSIAPLLNENQKFPFVAWYPFDTENSLNYHVVYTYQVVCIWYITAANINLDSLTYALLMYIWSQCDLLCDDLSKMNGEIGFETKFRECVKHHKQIVRFATKSNEFFNMLIFGQFATSTLVLALTMFQLSLVHPVSEEAFTHLSYITGISTQLLLYCWFGNEVEIKSSQIPFALYKSDWFDQPTHVKKNLLIFSVRCQNPIKITALNLFALSLRTFVAILRTAWSYFAVLYKVNNP
ncbi:odorant receptor Or1-like [Zophobas morio]|uniref:odorant receptor Or1-like n=1 Tax=Zophobas morio TaxID=2755281 RepID=UPI0030833974